MRQKRGVLPRTVGTIPMPPQPLNALSPTAVRLMADCSCTGTVQQTIHQQGTPDLGRHIHTRRQDEQ